MNANSATTILGVGLMLAVSVAVAGEDQGHAYLRELGKALTHARRLPLVAIQTSFSCPEDLSQFNGIPMATVETYLSSPNFVSSQERTYFLTGPRPPQMQGGGFPELTFVVSSAGAVERTTCHYAR